MGTSEEYELLIVGLGPVGALAANLAGKAGFRALAVDRDIEPFALPRAIVCDAEAMRIFASIGLAEQIGARTRSLGGSVYIGCDGKPIRRFVAPPLPFSGAWPATNLFYQPELEAALRKGICRFPRVRVELGTKVERLVANSDGVDVVLAGPAGTVRTVGARRVLGCDGGRSTVRRSQGISLDDIGFEERWLVIDSFVDGALDWPEDLEIPEPVRAGQFSLMVCDPARPATLIPGVGRHRRWEFMLRAGEFTGDEVPPEAIEELIARWIDPARVEIVRSAVYRFRALVADRWHEGPVLLLGDAAHQTPPFYGQGMCHGLRDAAQLIWRLTMIRDGEAGEALLDSYQKEREPHVRAIITASVSAGAAVCITDAARARQRDEEFRALTAADNAAPKAMTDVIPPITAGVIDPATGGNRLPQLLQDGQSVDGLIEGFTLFATSPDLRVRAPLRRVIFTQRSAVSDWLSSLKADWAILRPDRYLFASGKGQDALGAAQEQLAIALNRQFAEGALVR